MTKNVILYSKVGGRMIKQKTFNYLTLVLAIVTVFMAIYSYKNNTNPAGAFIMLVITVLFNYISRKYNNEHINLTKEDRESIRNNIYMDKQSKQQESVKQVNKEKMEEKK